jgi:hypothetical protein
MAKRRGRPRKGGPRTGSGRASRAYKSPEVRDQGTPEGQARRLAMVNGSARPELASIPLDVAFARGLVTSEQHAAGLKFRAARAACFGVLLPDREPGRGRAPDEDRVAQNERRYERMLARLSVDEQLAVVEVCALDAWPRWLMRVLRDVPPIATADEAERADLISGLDRLANSTETLRVATRLKYRKILELAAERPDLLQREIAELVGVTPSRVSAVLKRAEGG